MSIHPIYTIFLVVMTMRIPGRPRIHARRTSGMMGLGLEGMQVITTATGTPLRLTPRKNAENLTDVNGESDGSRQYQGTDKFHEDNKLHREAERAAKIPDKQ